MDALVKEVTRRNLLKWVGWAALALPLAKLGKVIERDERHRRRKKDLETLENIWIGHC